MMTDYKFLYQNRIRPFTKWAGGKQRGLASLLEYMPRTEISCYVEPLVGAGALFFLLRAKRNIINDQNAELINTYKVIRDDIMGLINVFIEWPCTKEQYMSLREWDRREDFLDAFSPTERAARFVYLMRFGFNGLHRVNALGQFNTPFGRYNIIGKEDPKSLIITDLLRCNEYLNAQHTTICNGDYEELIDLVPPHAFVYLDPPYAPLSKTANFTSFNQEEWTYDDHARLYKFCLSLDRKGIMFMLSNSNVPFIQDLYCHFRIHTRSLKRSIVAKTSHRKNLIEEVVICNY